MTTPNNLPAELSSFVGRETQLAELRRLLRKSRLITVTGPGGAGKTRLALRLASTVLDRYPGGAWLVELGTLTDPALVERTVAVACGIGERKGRPISDLLVKRLTGRRSLLILDGGEHLVDACAVMAGQLLSACPELILLVTSREPLGVRGELIWRIPSLTVPSPEQAGRTELLLKSEAVRLFIDRARLAQPNFTLDRSTSTELAEVCTQLDGLPLAIELAASLVDAMTVHEIRERLGDRFRLLTGSRRSAVPRHQTLRQAIDWSYQLLSSDEKALFAQLAVFADGFDIKAAEAMGGLKSAPPAEVLPTLRRLVGKSLVIAESRGPLRMRYRLLDTIREYALEKLQQEDLDNARRRHAMYILDFSKETSAKLRLGDQADGLARIEDDEANIRLALAWCQTEAPDQMVLLTGYVLPYWATRGRFLEGLEWLDRALETTGQNPEARLKPLRFRAALRRLHGDYVGARRDAEECAALARRLGAEFHLMAALGTLGILSSIGDSWDEAGRFCREALQISLRLGDSKMIAGALNNLALVESARGNHEGARIRLDQALQEAHKANDPLLMSTVLESTARVERRLGANGAARQKYIEAIGISSELEDVMNTMDILDGLALLALSAGDPTRALVLVAASSRQRAVSNSERSPRDEEEVRQCSAVAQGMLRTSAAEAALRRGSALSLREAVAYASGATAGPAVNGGTPLTPREVQVASLIVEGLTNIEIAKRLHMADRTADAHVEHIRNKLGLRTRSQIAVWAHEHLDKY